MSELNVSDCSKTDFELNPSDHGRLSALCGQFNENLNQIEKSLAVEINCRGNKFSVVGEQETTQSAKRVLTELYSLTAKRKPISREQVHLSLQEYQPMNQVQPQNKHSDIPLLKTKHGVVKPRGKNQIDYVQRILTNDISFGIGPAGTGKTYLAVAAAVDALLKDEVSRIVLTRPAVEAGERLGLLPGDLAQKVDPYLRPLYDALYEMLGFERVPKLMERHVIEIAPLAYMRGRT